ncbi:histidine phosphatase family protein [Rhodopirellula sallentina]|uniref:histidine phosphatase family protein n=1 Tax=Rhodopirellula sallentina TaxID=1263869 RepID=UPI0005C7E653|nr:histidine phosphatase family protein [Rhodopirellula sallentina]
MNTQSLRNRFFVLRHGQSEANELSLIASCPTIAVERYGLTTKGREQVRESVSQQHEELKKVKRIYTSDFLRTRQTAEIAAEQLGVPIENELRLRERYFGQWDGQSDQNYQTVWAADHEDASHQKWGVESVRSVSQRTLEFLLSIDNENEGENYLLVSHGDPLQILITTVAGTDLRLHRQIRPLQTAALRCLADQEYLLS